MSDIGQTLLIGVPGKYLDKKTEEQFKKIQPGGFIIFGRNIESPDQLRNLIDHLRSISKIEPIITIDQEGGRVSRLRLIGSEPPSVQDLRNKKDETLIKYHGILTGKLLRLFGFNLNLCPVLDISFDDNADNSLKGRCYGTTPEQVINYSSIFNNAMRNEGILSTGKHFPGYASAYVDPHHEISIIDRSINEMENFELKPFAKLIPNLDCIMICHSHYTCWDKDNPKLPASMSKNIINNLLIKKLNYKGLIMTDDLDMGAIINENGFEESVYKCMMAGNHMIMICHRIELAQKAIKVIESINEAIVQKSVDKIKEIKKNISCPYKWSIEQYEQINNEIWNLRVDTMGEERAKIKTLEDGKRSPVELY